MKDIPIFTGENGVATLILREIPHQQRAYVMLRTVWRLQPFLSECRAFCRMAGAESVYVTGQEDLSGLPFVHAMERWTCRRAALPPLAATQAAMASPAMPATVRVVLLRTHWGIYPTDHASFLFPYPA